MIQPIKQVKWRSLVSEQEESRQSVAALCRARGLSESLFYYWKKRFNINNNPNRDIRDYHHRLPLADSGVSSAQAKLQLLASSANRVAALWISRLVRCS